MGIRRIDDLNISDRNWSFRENGVLHFLKASGRREESPSYCFIDPSVEPGVVFRIFGGGNLLENNKLTTYFILEKTGRMKCILFLPLT